MNEQHTGNPALLSALERCGHFLHHRRGGKMGQERILRILYRHEQESPEQGLDQLALQDMLGIRSGSISEIIGKMEAGGLICKTRQADDRRRICLSLTDAGREALRRDREEKQAQEAVLFAALEEAEQEELRALIERLLADWEKRFDPQLTHRCARRSKGAEKPEGEKGLEKAPNP